MKRIRISRRKFIRSSIAAGAAAALPIPGGCSFGSSPFDPRGLTVRELGNTGVKVPLLAFGTGSRFMAVEGVEKRLEMLEYALDHGLYYWDTAAIYKETGSDLYSEEVLGTILKSRRSEVFLASKVSDRDPELARRTIEKSLSRLQTDYLDLYQVHSIESAEDARSLGKTGGVLDVLHQYRDEGIIRHIGFSGHRSTEGMRLAAELYDFDTMLIAMNHWVQWDNDPEKQVIPAVAANGLGIIAMKLIRPRDTIEGLDPLKLIRYALSLEHVSAASIGMDSMEVLRSNIELIRDFKPLPDTEMQEMQLALEPFFGNRDLEWMRPGYRDGITA